MYFVYALCDSADPSTIRYVGKTNHLRRRRDAHLLKARQGEHSYRSAWIRQVIASGRDVHLVTLAECQRECEAFDLERQHIARLRAEGARLTNLSDGGEGPAGCVASSETRRKMSESRRGYKVSEETKRKIGDANRGRPSGKRGLAVSEETRRKLSAANMGKHYGPRPPRSEEFRQKMREIALQRRHSEETRRKIGDMSRGRKYGPRSPETRAKMSAALKGRVMSDEARGKMRLAKLGVKRGPNSPEWNQKIAAANRGKVMSPESRRKISEAKKGKLWTEDQRRRMSDGVRAWWAKRKQQEHAA